MRIKFDLFFILFLLISLYEGFIEQTIILFACVLVHELGHAAAAGLLHIHVEEVTLFPFGGIARMEDLTKYGGYYEAGIAAAGPLISGLAALVFLKFSGSDSIGGDFFRCNFMLFSFNLIPALPLDGGRIARNIFIRFVSYRQATRLMVLTGRIMAIALLIYNIILMTRGSNSLVYALAAVFVFMGTIREVKYSAYYYLLHQNDRKNKGNGSRKRVVKVHSDMQNRFVASQFSPGNRCIIKVVDDAGNVQYQLSEAEIMDALLKYGYDSTIGEIKK